jgi:dinuclear metal center YbgI/SA1388 family protein
MTTGQAGEPEDELAESITVADVVAALEHRYPPHLAAEWDAVGLVVGSLSAPVQRVHIVLDVNEETLAEVLETDADFVLAHHPLLFRPVTTVAETRSRGRIISALIENHIALYCAHTNADHARPGVSDALAETLGLLELAGGPTEPIEPVPSGQLATGTGRIGDLPTPHSLADFAAHVEQVLGRRVRVAGDRDRQVQRVAVCGGAGDSLLGLLVTRPDVDVFVTADLRHHVVLDHLAEGGCALIDAGHWATEVPWLPRAAELLRTDVEDVTGMRLEITLSGLVTDPWAE